METQKIKTPALAGTGADTESEAESYQSPVIQTIADFANTLFQPEDVIELRCIKPGAGKGKARIVQKWCKASEITESYQWLSDRNQEGFNVYVGANPRNALGVTGDDNVPLARSIFADFDHCSIDEAVARIAAAGVPTPTMTIDSGHGCHAYWLLDKPFTDLTAWSDQQKDLIALLGSDKSIHNPERIMRMPGFRNWKAPVADCTIIDRDSSRIYDATDLYLTIPSRTASAKHIEQTPRAIADAIQNGDRNSTLTSLAGSMRHRGMTTDAITAALLVENRQKCRPPLDEQEVRSIAESVARYQPAPKAPPIPPPTKLGQTAYHGITGQILRLIEPHSEADPAALLAHFLTQAGNVIDRKAWFSVGGQKHHGNLFVALVGSTSMGRKGTAQSDSQYVWRDVDDAWLSERHLSGLSSGEGLIWAVRDPIHSLQLEKKSKEMVMVMTDPGITDKRLLVTESEFASVLRRMGRESNTLSMIVRQAWDGGKLQTMTKTCPATSTDAHVSIIAHITRDELVREMAATESFNGFVNRYLWFVVTRSKLLPDGGDLDSVDFGATRSHLRQVVEYAKSNVLGKVHRDSDAQRLWHEVYGELTADTPGALGATTARAAPQVMRLALVYAALDLSAIIRTEHLQAALEVWRYCRESAAYLFGGASYKLPDKYLAFLIENNGRVSVRELQRKFPRDFPTSDDAKAKLSHYAGTGIGIWTIGSPDKAGGRPSEVFCLKVGMMTKDKTPESASANGVLSNVILSTPEDGDVADPEREAIQEIGM